MSTILPLFVNTLRHLILERSFRINSFARAIPWLSENFDLVKSKITFSDCPSVSRKLFCTVYLLPPIGDFSSQRQFVFNTYKSGVRLAALCKKTISLLKIRATISAACFSCSRGADSLESSIYSIFFSTHNSKRGVNLLTSVR